MNVCMYVCMYVCSSRLYLRHFHIYGLLELVLSSPSSLLLIRVPFRTSTLVRPVRLPLPLPVNELSDLPHHLFPQRLPADLDALVRAAEKHLERPLSLGESELLPIRVGVGNAARRVAELQCAVGFGSGEKGEAQQVAATRGAREEVGCAHALGSSKNEFVEC